MKKRTSPIRRFFLLCSFAVASVAAAQTPPATQPAHPGKLYVVGYAHLDTQWRWSFPQVIGEFLRNTMEKNFPLLEKYPDYIFNFTGANRYMIMQETYPEDFAKLKEWVAKGRWFPAGSSMEEGDVDMPSAEGIIRQVLYGNEYFRKEFGIASCEFMLPDSFGFQASLPSVLAHCGLKGFSTQKLTWASAVGIPFNVGVWEGPDGKGVVASLNPGGYTSKIENDLSSDQKWIDRVQDEGNKSGVYVDYHYYGTGDQGGAPPESSVQWMEQSVHGPGPLHVVSATAGQMFDDLTPEQVAKLPRYKGDLLLTNHSAGSLSSEAYIKRWNRKNEQLADATERASVIADWLGTAKYPMEKLNNAWRLVLASHFHDTMAGTAVPKAYEYSWNNDVIAMNEFAAAEKNAVSGIVGQMDTRGQGVPLVIYNPLSFARQDVVEATVTMPQSIGQSVGVFGSDGKEVPSQITARNGDKVSLLFLASAPSVGFCTYSVRETPMAGEGTSQGDLSIKGHTLENARYRVTVNDAGDIASVYDKSEQKEMLAAPARLAFQYSKPEMYPAWNMDWADEQKPAQGYVDGPAKITVVENGPVRVALQVERETRGSKFIQQIRLSTGDAGNTVEVANTIDWQSRQCSLKAVFPFTASNSMASYESQSAVVKRGNNNEKKFEVPQQMWLDLTNQDGKFGAAVLNDCKYGSDKPDDNTIRLTLLYTPGVRKSFQDQATQDFGRHNFVYSLASHAGDWRQGNVPLLAARLNQPLRGFIASTHKGPLGKDFSMMQISNDHVAAIAMKKAEKGDGVILRLHELNGEAASGVHVKFARAIKGADEVDGQERKIGPASVKHGELVVDLSPFILRAYELNLGSPKHHGMEPAWKDVKLDYNVDAISSRKNPTDGAFTSAGQSYPAEALPDKIENEDVGFTLGPKGDGQKNAVACHGQTITLPTGYDHVYFLAAADGDVSAPFQVGDRTITGTVQNWTGYIGSWDLRLWGGIVAPLAFDWHNPMNGLVPAFIKRAEVAWYSNYRHDAVQGNQYYRFCYLFKYGFALPKGTKEITLPNEPKVKIFAMSVAKDVYADATPASPLYDTFNDRPGDMAAPTIMPNGGKFSGSVAVRIGHPLYWDTRRLHYTVDGTTPTADSPAYAKAIHLDQSATVRVAEINENGHAGQVVSAKFHVTPAPTTAPAQ